MSPTKILFIGAAIFSLIALIAVPYVPAELLDLTLTAGFLTLCASIVAIEFLS